MGKTPVAAKISRNREDWERIAWAQLAAAPQVRHASAPGPRPVGPFLRARVASPRAPRARGRCGRQAPRQTHRRPPCSASPRRPRGSSTPHTACPAPRIQRSPPSSLLRDVGYNIIQRLSPVPLPGHLVSRRSRAPRLWNREAGMAGRSGARFPEQRRVLELRAYYRRSTKRAADASMPRAAALLHNKLVW